ncbi:NUDIX hydrolase [Rugosimonospora africana]|nr:NUDIX hydrolase [Rugosimonospora africana]
MKQRRRIAVHGVAHDPGGRVLLVPGAGDAGPDGDEPDGWHLPGGVIEHGERPADAVVRTYREQTGLDVKVLTVRNVRADVVRRAAAGVAVHTDRVIYAVTVAGSTLRNGGAAPAPPAEWVGPERLGERPLAPYVAEGLALPVTESEILVEAEPDIDPARRTVQRFAAYGLVTDPADRLLLCRIAPGYPGAGTWHLPGGGTDFGEQATAGLLRELAEEADQKGRVIRLLDVSDFRNPAAMGPEGYPMDWQTVRVLYRVEVDEPVTPRVTEAAGGSTADAAWFRRAELHRLRLNQFARSSIGSHLV